MEPSRTATSSPAISRRARPPAGVMASGPRAAVSGAGSRSEGEPGDPPSDIPPPRAWRSAPLFAAAPVPSPAALFWLLVVAAGAAALYWLARRHKTLGAALSADPWADPGAVANTLVLALDQRAVFRLSGRPADAVPAPGLEGVGTYLGRRALLLLPARDMADAAAWTGRPVRAEFGVAVGDGLRFFRFDSVVLRCATAETRPLLELARPERLVPYRRRTFPRVRPARPDVAALGLWRLEAPVGGRNDALRPGAGLPPDPARLAAPLFVFRPGRAASVRLDNLSAAGLGLRVPADASPPAHCLVFLCLRTPGGAPLALWLACERRHLTTRTGRATATLGLRIAHWGRVARADALIPWKPTAADGSVPLLLRWTLRRAAVDAPITL